MELEYLDPKTTVFDEAPDGTLRVTIPDRVCGLRVEAIYAFPLSHPGEHVVLRDGAGQEIGVLRNVREVGEPAQTRLREQLRRRYFLPRITEIRSISERFGSSVWDLQTDRGARVISTGQMNEAVFEIEAGRYLITDVEGNRYEIPNLHELDAASRARFQGKY